MYIMEGMDDIIHSSMKTIIDGCMVGDGEEGRYVARCESTEYSAGVAGVHCATLHKSETKKIREDYS